MTDLTNIEEAITNWFGPRCDDYEKGCQACDAWSEYDALTARESAGEVRVKPLDWEEDCNWRYCGKPPEPIGKYCKWAAQGGDGTWYVAGQDGRFNTLDEAKAAAQDDYERRIRSTLA